MASPDSSGAGPALRAVKAAAPEGGGLAPRAASRAAWVLALASSLALAAAAVWAAHQPLPHVLSQQRHELLRPAGSLIWPAVLIPWLPLIPGRFRYLAAWLAAPVGFCAQLQPLLFSLDPHVYIPVIPNIRLLPWVLLAGVAGTALAWAQPRWTRRLPRAAALVSLAALVAAAGGLALALHPVASALALPPGAVAVGDLRLAETVVLEGAVGAAGDQGLVGFVWEGTLVVCGPDSLLWRDPDGTATVRRLPLHPVDIEMQAGEGRVWIVERRAGRVRCFACPGGEVAWEAGGLGTIDQSAWTEDAAWFLDQPDPGESRALSPLRLHRVDLRDGRSAPVVVEPPPGTHWPVPTEGEEPQWPLLKATGDTAYLVGWVAPGPDGEGAGGEASKVCVLRPAQEGRAAAAVVIPGEDVVRSEWIGVAGEAVVYLGRGANLSAVARDIATGAAFWSFDLGATWLAGSAFTVLPGVVVVDAAAKGPPPPATAPSGTGRDLVGLDPRSGKELWRQPRGAEVNWVEAAGPDVLVMTNGGLLRCFDGRGGVKWTYPAAEPAYVLSIEESRDRLVLFESGGQQLPNAGYWGLETVLQLSDGAVVSRAQDQPGAGNWMALDDGRVYRTRGRRTGSYLRNRLVLRMEGPGVGIHDCVRHTDSVLAGRGLVAAACRVGGNDVRVYVLEAR